MFNNFAYVKNGFLMVFIFIEIYYTSYDENGKQKEDNPNNCMKYRKYISKKTNFSKLI